jgi:hypothetical protein
MKIAADRAKRTTAVQTRDERLMALSRLHYWIYIFTSTITSLGWLNVDDDNGNDHGTLISRMLSHSI